MSVQASPKFYHTVFANRHVATSGMSIKFDPYSLTGSCWLGVYKASDDDEIKALDELARNPKSGITVIDAEEFELCEKKRNKGGRGYSAPSLIVPKSQASAEAAEVGEAVDPNPDIEEEIKVGTPIADAEEALKVAVIPESAATAATTAATAPTTVDEAAPAAAKKPRKK